MARRVTRKPMPEMQFEALARLSGMEPCTMYYSVARAFFVECMSENQAADALDCTLSRARYAVHKINLQSKWLAKNWDDLRRAHGEHVPVPVKASVWDI